MRVALIVAASDNNVIGNNNALPWHLPADFAFFRQTTMGKPVVMGRKTYESIGRPLPGRPNVVISRNPDWRVTSDVEVVSSVPAAIARARVLAEASGQGEVMVIGGAEIYRLTLPDADRVYLTRVHARIEGDAFFPELDPAVWQLTSVRECPADERNRWDFSFLQYDRVTKS